MLRFRPLLLRLLMLALVLRASIPAGFMPDMSALQNGALRLVICTATGPQDIWVDETGHQVAPDDTAQSPTQPPIKHPDHSGQAATCAFAVAAQVTLAADAPIALALPPDAADAHFPHLIPSAPLRQNAAQQPRAPPLSFV
jgi:hypothetical protein